MGIADDVKELEDNYNYAKERICELLDEKIEYGKTIRRLTIELNDTKKDRNNIEQILTTVQRREDKAREENLSLAESKKKLESMLDLCESSCSTCKKHDEFKNRVVTLERRISYKNTIISNRDRTIDELSSKLDTAVAAMHLWRDRWASLVPYCTLAYPRNLPK
jgi:chromosome segregation ATPase